MSVSTIFYSLLSGNSGVTALVSTKIYPQQAPQTTAYPFIVFNTISTVPTNTKTATGASTMDIIRVRVTMLHPLQSTIDSIGSAVRNCLDYVNNQTIGGQRVQFITYQDEVDMYDGIAGQDGVCIKHQDYILTLSR